MLKRVTSEFGEKGDSSTPVASDGRSVAGHAGTSVVDIRGLSLTYEAADGPVYALSDVDLQVAEGEFVSFIGPSGCGKTTLLRVIADLEQPSGGHIHVNGVRPGEARLQARIRLRLPGAGALSLADDRARTSSCRSKSSVFPKAERRERSQKQLDLVNLTGFEKKFPWQLSGGMQQRASIARALSFDPKLLLMDEPFGALDEIVRDHLNEQLLRLWDKTGKTVLFVTHSIPEAVFLSTRIVVMSPRPGRIIDIIDAGVLGPGAQAGDSRDAGIPEDRPPGARGPASRAFL